MRDVLDDDPLVFQYFQRCTSIMVRQEVDRSRECVLFQLPRDNF